MRQLVWRAPFSSGPSGKACKTFFFRQSCPLLLQLCFVRAAPYEGSWQIQGCVSPEGVRHMQSRVIQFNALERITGEPGEVPHCPQSWCRWVLSTSASYAAAAAVPRPFQQSPQKMILRRPLSFRIPCDTWLQGIKFTCRGALHAYSEIRRWIARQSSMQLLAYAFAALSPNIGKPLPQSYKRPELQVSISVYLEFFTWKG